MKTSGQAVVVVSRFGGCYTGCAVDKEGCPRQTLEGTNRLFALRGA